MAVRMAWLARPGVLYMLISRVRLVFRLLREPGVSLLAKTIPLAAMCYLVDPLDVVPDVVPILGEIDDLGFILVALEAFVRVCPTRAVEFHRSAIEHGDRYSPMARTTRPFNAGSDSLIDAEWWSE